MSREDLAEAKMNALAAAGEKWAKAKTVEREAMTSLYAAIVDASNEGLSEVLIAKVTGVDRMTVRRALGKR